MNGFKILNMKIVSNTYWQIYLIRFFFFALCVTFEFSNLAHVLLDYD